MANLPTMILCRGHNNPMLKCGRCKDSEFYKSRSEFAYYPETIKKEDASTGYLPFCKSCVQKIFETQLEHKKDMQIAFYYTCQKLDIPFITELFDEVVLSKRDNNGEYANIGKRLVGEYIQRLNTNKTKYGSKLDFSYSDTTLSSIDVKIAELDNNKKDLERFQIDWGTQDTVDDYIFLQDRYEQYTEGVEFTNAFHPDLYRDLCRDRLILRKILEGRNKEEEISKVQDRINKLATQLKVNEFRVNRPKTPSELTLFEKIKLVDENNVNDVYNKPTINFDLNKFIKYEEDLVLRPTLKTLINHRDYDLKLEDLEQYDIK